ncbi:glycerophosphodiester phosphodiesterase family protein [Micromonospora luteifusca]|uniref:glycerophosphodiester phosphodiesterase family protein n=1 Tax=Micromonospora luteifusca TaxID=709860 RepID=UPI00355629A4
MELTACPATGRPNPGGRPRRYGPAGCRPTGRCTTRCRAPSPQPTGTCGRTRRTSTNRTSGPLQTRYDLKVIPYTVDDATVMQRVIDLGVDGRITDDPDLLVSVAIRNGLR